MQSFVLSVDKAQRSKMLLKRTAAMRKRAWDKTVLRNGLECRSAVGSCKMRFVTYSEDVWFANTARHAAKRASRNLGGSPTKRLRLGSYLESRLPREGAQNALLGMPQPTSAPLPSAHKLKPLEAPEAA